MADDKRVTQVSLGCGTLILIALIVIFFSGRGNAEVEREIRALREDIVELRRTIDAQTSQIRLLETKLDKVASKDK